MSASEADAPREVTPAPRAEATSRLDWLDALRGIAVLLVLYEHLTWHVLGVLRSHTDPWFNAGRSGVFLFFIISGYIVPASLERRGCLRTFWISRIFRLYPMIILGAAATLILAAHGAVPIDPVATEHTWATAIVSTTMLQDLLALPSTPPVLWSLSYEIIFYLLVSALFVFRLHRLSAVWSVLFAGIAFGLGSLLLVVTLSDIGLQPRDSAVLILLAVVGGVGALMSGRRALVISGAVVVSALAMMLLLTSYRFPGWHLFSIPAAMFAGTAIYRAEQRQVSWRLVGPALGAVFLGVVGGVVWSLPDWRSESLLSTLPWVGGMTLAAALFAFGMSLRYERFPAILVKLGVISYSVYIVHSVLVLWLEPFLQRYHDDALVMQIIVAAWFVAVVVAFSAWTYRYVEQPSRELGRRLARALD